MGALDLHPPGPCSTPASQREGIPTSKLSLHFRSQCKGQGLSKILTDVKKIEVVSVRVTFVNHML